MEINEKKLKDILTEQREEYQCHLDSAVEHFDSQVVKQREEYQRYLGVVAENFESQVKLLAESVVGVQEQLIALRDLVVKNTRDIGVIREMVAKNTEDIEIMKGDLNIIKYDLKEKVSREEFKLMEKRLELLERKFQKA